ncbi:hypothetical protein Micbo1qcDRAFT_218104 [Microdochium bolleyi]|uniref:Uncharacterized protein n=1 Tax=Microdochium bolleyi TaxID=196109 RepID=A0A136JGE7_9PEZI|nr:hypothetical protein Micbo1qcDRAFT_218104 [Microdochium bolleyi]
MQDAGARRQTQSHFFFSTPAVLSTDRDTHSAKIPSTNIPANIPYPPARLATRTSNSTRPSLSLITDLDSPIPLKMRFQAPQLGALGVAYTTMRLAQFVSLVTVIGLTGRFIDEIVVSQRAVPEVLVGTIAVSSIAVLYVVVSYILYYDSLLPLLVGCAVDGLMLIATIVVAATLGKPGPLSLLNCDVLPEKSAAAPAMSTLTLSVSSTGTSSVGSYASRAIAAAATAKPLPVDLLGFYAQDQPHCYQIKAVWGLSIALCVLFAFSSIVSAGLWRRIKGPGGGRAGAVVAGGGGGGALGTKVLSPTGAAQPRVPYFPPPPTAATVPVPPERKRGLFPILRSPGVLPPVPTIVVHSSSTASVNTFTGPPVGSRSLTGGGAAQQQRRPPMPLSNPPPTLRIVPYGAPTLSDSPGEGVPTSAVAEAGFIPIMHHPAAPPAPARINTSPFSSSARNNHHEDEEDNDDDGFTPVTPGRPAATRGRGNNHSNNNTTSPRSPRSAGGGITGLSPRDALGIPIGKIILRMTSFRSSSAQQAAAQKAVLVDIKPPGSSRSARFQGVSDIGDDDEYEDVTPLTPANGAGFSEKGGSGSGSGSGSGVKRTKTVRQTLFGLVDGWWDLGLLERGKSLRKGGAAAAKA